MEVVGLIVLCLVGGVVGVCFFCLIGSLVTDLFSRRDISKNIQPIVSASQQIKPSDVDWTQMRTLAGQQSAQEARLRAQSDLEANKMQRERIWNEMVDRNIISSFNSGFSTGVGAIAIGRNVTSSWSSLGRTSLWDGASDNPLGDKKSKAEINKVFNKKFKKKRSNQNG